VSPDDWRLSRRNLFLIIDSVLPYGYALLATGWIVWMLPFMLNGWNFNSVTRQDKRARWGILLQVAGYSLLWQTKFWEHRPDAASTSLAALFFVLAALLSWTGMRALGRHWRVDAALSLDHQLVRSGPYGLIRHPIYTSMLCMMLGTGFLITPIPWLLAALAVFIFGTEIRVRVEDALLDSRFAQEFREYRRTVKAYLPLLR
jgi:protein-S-isoprenylcysteine O-methyltransferase Ste14